MSSSKPLIAAAMLGVTFLAACSSSAGTSTPAPSASSTAGPADSAGAATQAEAALKPYENDDPPLNLTPLKSAPPKGKTITYVSCSLAACADWETGLKQAAAKLGWTVKTVNEGVSPDTVTSTWNSLAQNPGDAVVANSLLPDSAIAGQLKTLQAKHVPVIELNGSNTPGGAVIAKLGSQAQNEAEAKIWADWIVADSGGKADVAYYNEPSYPDLKPLQDSFTSELGKLCSASCPVSVQTFAAADIGKAVPSQAVSYVQSHPNVAYLVFPVGDAMAGIPQALAAAGLAGKVKLVSGRNGKLTLQAIASGQQAMGTFGPSNVPGWQALDLVIRYWENGPLPDPQPMGILHVVTKANVNSDINQPWTVPDYQAQFLKAWLLSS